MTLSVSKANLNVNSSLLAEQFWFDLASIEPYKFWKGGFIYGFFFEKGIYDTSPLNDFIEYYFSGASVKQHLTIAVTNILNGAFVSFEEHVPNEDLIKILQASVSFSGISPAIEFGDDLLIAGNAIYENDVMSAINHCEALGYAEEQIVIDSIVGGATELPNF